MRSVTRFASIAVIAVGLSGCLEPTPFSVASLVFDAGSYMVSGKTLADHGVSGVTGQDCAVSRLVTEGAVCREEVTYVAAPTILEPLPASDAPVAQAQQAQPVPPSAAFASAANDGYLRSSLLEGRQGVAPLQRNGSQLVSTGYLSSGLGDGDRL